MSVTCTVPASLATTIGSLETYGAFETGSVEITLEGYDVNNRNETAAGWIKRLGEPESSYRPFHYFIRYDGNHMISSLFDLSPNTTYDVKVELNDPDTGTHTAYTNVTTRPEYSIPTAQREVPVSSSSALQAAINSALPGDHIIITEGDYFDTVELYQVNGVEDAPIVLTSNDGVEKPHFYRGIQAYQSSHIVLNNLEVEAIDPSDSRVTNPVALGYGGVDFRGSHHVVITNCYIHDCDEEGAGGAYRANIFIEHNDENDGPDKNGYYLILDNVIADEVHPSWEWNDHNSCQEIPGHTYIGIKFDFKPGGFNIIRGNYIYGCVDGIAPSGDEGWDPPEPTDTDVLANYQNQNIDIYDNIIYHNRDDAIELDGHMVNGRIFSNHIGECMNAISTAPVYPGPIFVLKNTIGGYKENVSKLNTAVSVVVRNIYWYHNTAVQPDFMEKDNTWCLYRGMPGYTDGLTFKNNIFSARRSIIDTDIFGYHLNHNFDYNNVYSHRSYAGQAYTGNLYIWGEEIGDRERYQTFEDFQDGTGQETHGIYGEPLLDETTEIGILRPAGYLSDDCYSVNYFLYSRAPFQGSPGIDRGDFVPGVNDDYGGLAPDCGAVEFESPATVDGVGSPGLPKVFSLKQNYPNPFNPSTTIDFVIPDAVSRVQLKIYDLRGRIVKTLADGEKEQGSYMVHWDGKSDRGMPVSSGIYLYRLNAGQHTSTKKMLIVR
jgi:hypothetical protein